MTEDHCRDCKKPLNYRTSRCQECWEIFYDTHNFRIEPTPEHELARQLIRKAVYKK